jgi:hypothetical protein
MKAGRWRSLWGVCAAPKAGVKGVRGVLEVEMYLPVHFGQRPGSSVVEADTGRTPFGFPALRGW